jgi:hypothetical protein
MEERNVCQENKPGSWLCEHGYKRQSVIYSLMRLLIGVPAGCPKVTQLGGPQIGGPAAIEGRSRIV